MEIAGALALVKHLHRDKDPDRSDAGVHPVVTERPAHEPQPEPRPRRFARDPQREWGGVHERPRV